MEELRESRKAIKELKEKIEHSETKNEAIEVLYEHSLNRRIEEIVKAKLEEKLSTLKLEGSEVESVKKGMAENTKRFSEEIRELKKTKFLLEDLILEREIKTKEYTLALINREKNALTPVIELLESLVSDTHKDLSKKIMGIRSTQDNSISNEKAVDLSIKLNEEKKRNEEYKNSIRDIQDKLAELSSSENRIVAEVESKAKNLIASQEKMFKKSFEEITSRIDCIEKQQNINELDEALSKKYEESIKELRNDIESKHKAIIIKISSLKEELDEQQIFDDKHEQIKNLGDKVEVIKKALLKQIEDLQFNYEERSIEFNKAIRVVIKNDINKVEESFNSKFTSNEDFNKRIPVLEKALNVNIKKQEVLEEEIKNLAEDNKLIKDYVQKTKDTEKARKEELEMSSKLKQEEMTEAVSQEVNNLNVKLAKQKETLENKIELEVNSLRTELKELMPYIPHKKTINKVELFDTFTIIKKAPLNDLKEQNRVLEEIPLQDKIHLNKKMQMVNSPTIDITIPIKELILPNKPKNRDIISPLLIEPDCKENIYFDDKTPRDDKQGKFSEVKVSKKLIECNVIPKTVHKRAKSELLSNNTAECIKQMAVSLLANSLEIIDEDENNNDFPPHESRGHSSTYIPMKEVYAESVSSPERNDLAYTNDLMSMNFKTPRELIRNISIKKCITSDRKIIDDIEINDTDKSLDEADLDFLSKLPDPELTNKDELAFLEEDIDNYLIEEDINNM